MRTVVVLFVLLLSGCATWTKTDAAMEGLYVVTHAVDYKQTRQAAKTPDDYKESNFFLGSHPSVKRIDTHFLLTGAAHVLVSHYLKKEKRLWQQVTMGWELIMVGNNYSVGLEVKF